MMLITIGKRCPQTPGRAKAQVPVASRSDERRRVQLEKAECETRQLVGHVKFVSF